MVRTQQKPRAFAERRQARRRRSLAIILEAVAEVVRDAYIRERRMREQRGTMTASTYQPGVQWDGGVDEHGEEHPAIWPRIAKLMVLHGFDPDVYVRSVFKMQADGKMPKPMKLLNPAILAKCKGTASWDADNLGLAWTAQKNILRAHIQWYRTAGGRCSRRSALGYALLNETTAMSVLFRYCIGHKKELADVCRKFRIAAVAQYMRHPREYDQAWGDRISVGKLLGFVDKEQTCRIRPIVEGGVPGH